MQNSGHSDFGQPGYPLHYGLANIPQAMASMPTNSTHDMNKSLGGQQAIFANPGMVAANQQHSQSQMQQAALVQQGQQMRALSNYYQRQAVPRHPNNVGRSHISNVVSHSNQQPSAPYGAMQHYPQYTQIIHPQVYQQRPLPYAMNNPQVYTQMPYNNYNGTVGSSNTYYPFPIQTPMPTQPLPAQPQSTSKTRSKAIQIINPHTMTEVDLNTTIEDSLHQSADIQENTDPTIGLQFASQVAATLSGSETSSVSSPQLDESIKISDSSNLCPNEKHIEGNIDDSVCSDPCDTEISDLTVETESKSDNELTENHANLSSESDIPMTFYQKNSAADDNKRTFGEHPLSAEDSQTSDMQQSKSYEKDPNCCRLSNLLESTNVTNDIDSIEPDRSTGVQEAEIHAVENHVAEMDSVDDAPEQPLVQISGAGSEPQDAATIDTAAEFDLPSAASKSLESKKKQKKKKDINRRGESKDGGDMDAFLDASEETTLSSRPVVSPVPQVSAITVHSLNDSERPVSPVTITDPGILETIPLPGESSPQNELPAIESTIMQPVLTAVDTEDKENIMVEDLAKPGLKYGYKEDKCILTDQWSPLNPEGKKQYDRDFLLQLQGHSLSMTKPLNLPNLDVIKDKATLQTLTEVNRSPPGMVPPPMQAYRDFMPSFARSPRGGMMPHMMPGRPRGGKGKDIIPKRIVTLPSLSQPVKLHEAEKAWKPMRKQDFGEVTMEEQEKEKLKRNVQAILNKLTPQKFSKLLELLQALNIDTEEKLSLVIDLIFEKAVDEPNFSVPYANMCKHLALTKVPLAGQPNQFVNFRKLLLTKCQREFEKDSYDELKHEERLKAIEEAEPDKKKELQLEYDEEEKKNRYRQLGNIRFIGELFKISMLTEPIMHECLRRLLNVIDEESLECLCKLLKTIGKELEEKGKSKDNKFKDLPTMELYFAQMQKIVDKRLTSSRVRFMLQDVIDLRKNNWVPRRDENNPKTIDQIHKEAEREAREQQQVLQNMSYPKRPPDDRDRRKPPGRGMNVTEDGWTSTSKSSKSYSLDPSKLKLTKPEEAETIRLGPGGRGNWGRGSSGGNKATNADGDKSMTANRYSALAESNLEGRREQQRSAASSRESSHSRSGQLPTAAKKPFNASKERESGRDAGKENLLLHVKDTFGSANESKVAEAPKPNSETYLNGKSLDDLTLRGLHCTVEEMDKKTKPLIDEFLHNNDAEEATRCITELVSPNTVHLFINAALNQVLERSSQARSSLGQLLHSLVKKNMFTLDQYKKGFSEVLESIDDYALDIPMIWDYIGEILEPMIENNEMPLTFLNDVLEPCIPSETAGKLVSSVLHCAGQKKGTMKYGEVWRESNLQWENFLGPGVNIDDFITKHKLEFTIAPSKLKSDAQMSIEDINAHLTRLLKEKKENEELFDWVDANVLETNSAAFIRALVHCIHFNAITDKSHSGDKCDLDIGLLKQRLAVLIRYIDHNQDLEIEAIYSLQNLMHQLNHPQGLMKQMFELLYDEDVIRDTTFYKWEEDVTNEEEGRDFALQTTKPFFTWLKESVSDQEET